MPLDFEGDNDLKWLAERRGDSKDRVDLKNASTYIDVVEGKTSIPTKVVTKDMATSMLDRSFSSLKAHWQAESVSNPIVTAANKSLKRTP